MAQGDMVTPSPTFNLVYEPWLRVRMLDGRPEVMSLTALFENMSDIAVLNGEMQTQDTAVRRLLMAILIRALRVGGELRGPHAAPADIWDDLYDDEDIHTLVVEYLQAHVHRFDLFDLVAPFFQVANLETKKGEHSDASVLVPDVGPGLFSTRTHSDAQVLDAASAARWLVRLQGYDVSGIKSGALGDPRVKGGKGYPIGTGWAGALGSIMLSGPSLRDTLLLNLPVGALRVARTAAEWDLPPWEREPDTSAPRELEDVQPNGIVDLLTWQQRRVRLFLSPTAPEVVGVLIANGDRLARANQFDEPYSAQRFSAAMTKKNGFDTWYPRPLDANLTVWRGVQSVFTEAGSAAASAPSEKGKKQVPDRPAPVLDQLRSSLGDIVAEALGDRPVGITMTGVAYGTQDALVLTEMSETIPASISLLTAEGRHLRRTAVTAVDRVLSFRGQLRWFLRQLRVCAGDSPEDYPEEQVVEWLDDLQIAFIHWLSELGGDTDADAADLQWRKTMWRITREAISRAVEQAGPRAAIGRIEETDTGSTFHSAARYESWIVSRLLDATGARYPSSQLPTATQHTDIHPIPEQEHHHE